MQSKDISQQKIHSLNSIDDIAKIEDSPHLKNLNAGVVIGDLWGYITDVNQVILDLYGAKDKKEFIGKHVLCFLVKEERSRAVKESLDSITNGKSKTVPYQVQLKNGQQITLIVTTILMVDKRGQQTGFVDIIVPAS